MRGDLRVVLLIQGFSKRRMEREFDYKIGLVRICVKYGFGRFVFPDLTHYLWDAGTTTFGHFQFF